MDAAPPPDPTLPAQAAALPALLHRLATPVGTIVNCLYLLEEDPTLSADARDTIEPLRRAAEGLTAALADARRLVDARELPLRMQAVDPLPVLEEATANGPPGFALSVEGRSPGRVRACPEGLALALRELVGRIAPATAGGARIPVRVPARGPGEPLRLIWEAPDASRLDPAGGDATALAVAETLLQRMGGALRCEVGPEGARAIVELEPEA